ncbi:hypothetical protein FIBSPDRAFT_754256 [Athelia psychrophila]|uniref:Uncharacterized protein n=1 Tax=Athelia psychrophila TaxID=1759441 RepID=A0A166BRG8_9AGAM|nr:hypothetical protein FIBSPDRAFT_754256 [Fibularhizoctonia sp. CBS 109695]
MPPYHISSDLKARIPVMSYELAYSVKEICGVLGVRKSLVYQVLQYHQVHRTVTPPGRRKAGHHRILTAVDIAFIRSLISLHHISYIDEIQEQLCSRQNVQVLIKTIVRTLCRLQLSNKDVSGRALEQNIEDRAVYMNRIADLAPDPNMLMFGDEASKDERTSARR